MQKTNDPEAGVERDEKVSNQLSLDHEGRIGGAISPSGERTRIIKMPGCEVQVKAMGEAIDYPQPVTHYAHAFLIKVDGSNYEAIAALEDQAYHDCRGCVMSPDGGCCVHHVIPPHDYIRSFCLAHPELRPFTCKKKDPRTSECPADCSYWELVNVEIASGGTHFPDENKEGPQNGVWVEFATFRERKPLF